MTELEKLEEKIVITTAAWCKADNVVRVAWAAERAEGKKVRAAHAALKRAKGLT